MIVILQFNFNEFRFSFLKKTDNVDSGDNKKLPHR